MNRGAARHYFDFQKGVRADRWRSPAWRFDARWTIIAWSWPEMFWTRLLVGENWETRCSSPGLLTTPFFISFQIFCCTSITGLSTSSLSTFLSLPVSSCFDKHKCLPQFCIYVSVLVSVYSFPTFVPRLWPYLTRCPSLPIDAVRPVSGTWDDHTIYEDIDEVGGGSGGAPLSTRRLEARRELSSDSSWSEEFESMSEPEDEPRPAEKWVPTGRKIYTNFCLSMPMYVCASR